MFRSLQTNRWLDLDRGSWLGQQVVRRNREISRCRSCLPSRVRGYTRDSYEGWALCRCRRTKSVHSSELFANREKRYRVFYNEPSCACNRYCVRRGRLGHMSLIGSVNHGAEHEGDSEIVGAAKQVKFASGIETVRGRRVDGVHCLESNAMCDRSSEIRPQALGEARVKRLAMSTMHLFTASIRQNAPFLARAEPQQGQRC